MSDRIIDILRTAGIDQAMIIYVKGSEMSVAQMNTTPEQQMQLSEILYALTRELHLQPTVVGLAKNFHNYGDKTGKA